jgi:leucyl-tRNA synthetase
VRTKLVFALDTPHAEIEKQVLAHPYVQKWTQGQSPKKVVIVPHRIVNVVV